MSGDDLGWAITTLARRSSAMWRFRLFLLAMLAGTAGIGMAATELRLEELFWLLPVFAVACLGGGVACLLRGPTGADVARAYAILEREVGRLR